MLLEINEDAARRWFSLPPDTPIDSKALVAFVDASPNREATRNALGEFLCRQMRDAVGFNERK